MPRTRPPFPPEFRQQILELLRAGRTPEELAREYEPTAQTIRNWIVQDELDSGLRSDGATTDEKAELARLRRENKRLRAQRQGMAPSHAFLEPASRSTPLYSTLKCHTP
jgi:transposase